MQGVQESLAGRVAVLNLFGLSDEEKGPILPALIVRLSGCLRRC